MGFGHVELELNGIIVVLRYLHSPPSFINQLLR